MKGRGPLAIGFVVAGVALPLLPRWIVPHLRPGVRYLESASSLLADRRAFVLFSALSALPFIVLAVFTWFHLRNGDRKRLIAVLVAFAAMFILGWLCQMPQSVAGVNFGVFVFPIYAAVLGPVAYGAARLALSFRRPRV